MSYEREYVFASACGGLLTTVIAIMAQELMIDILVDPVFSK